MPNSPRPASRSRHPGSLYALEVKLEAQLHLARPDCRVRDFPEAIIAESGIRCPEYRMIQGILRLDPELEVHLLAYLELIADRKIGREGHRGTDAAQRSRRIPQSKRGRTQETGVIVRGVACKVLVYPNLIRPVVTLGRSHNIRSL